MSTTDSREIDLSSITEQAQCHLMPCRIEHKGPTVRAREYFYPTIRKLQLGGDDEQGRERKHDESLRDNDPLNPILTASFRGRPLQGKKVPLPDGYKGYAVPKQVSSDKSRESSKTFDEFTYWNWDELPRRDDAVVKSLGWIDVSKAMHNPVE